MMRVFVGILLAFAAGGASAAEQVYRLPEETAVLAPGPDSEIAAQNCGSCHSMDYISTQPRGLKDPRAFWTAEVTKMQKAYGAQIDAADAQRIIEHLTEAYGK